VVTTPGRVTREREREREGSCGVPASRGLPTNKVSDVR
jgi:hypothetical protein